MQRTTLGGATTPTWRQNVDLPGTTVAGTTPLNAALTWSSTGTVIRATAGGVAGQGELSVDRPAGNLIGFARTLAADVSIPASGAGTIPGAGIGIGGDTPFTDAFNTYIRHDVTGAQWSVVIETVSFPIAALSTGTFYRLRMGLLGGVVTVWLDDTRIGSVAHTGLGGTFDGAHCDNAWLIAYVPPLLICEFRNLKGYTADFGVPVP